LNAVILSVADKLLNAVILSEAKNLHLFDFKEIDADASLRSA